MEKYDYSAKYIELLD